MPEKQEKNRNSKGQFVRGKSGNPDGRPKKEFCIPDILEKLVSEVSPFDPEGKKTRLERICEKAITQAEGGDRDARNWVADRMEGKAVERVVKQKAKDDLIILNPSKEPNE